MSGEPGNASATPAFRLLTLGTLALRETEAEASGPDHGQQGRRLALLAAVAAAGTRGRARDQLLLFFWPDASQDRARHSLEQSLYLIRRSLGPSVFAGVNPLRLDPAVLPSDVEEFEAALDEGRLEAAAALYGGPFLDGFYLSDAPEFEEWMVAERARLEARYRGALEGLAESAEAADDPACAVRWWRRLAEVDPLSVRPALGVMRGLAAGGDHAAALRHGQDYERLVERELRTSAGPELSALAEEIRSAAEAPRTAPRPVPPRRPEERWGAEPSLTPPADAGPAPGRQGPGVRRRLAYGAAAAALLAGFFVATRLGNEPPPPTATAFDASIVVLPLTNLSPDPDDAMLADGMTEELIGMLARTGDLRVIASTSAFAFRDRPADVRGIADSLRVTHVLEGGVRKAGSRLRVQVRLVDARDGATRWSETYDREVDDLFAVQEEIAGAVARELGAMLGGRGAPRVASHRPRSVAAYELYLRGNDPAHLRSDEGPHQGLEFFSQAIAIDSTYAAAWAGLARMYGRVASTANPGRPEEELFALSKEAALRAIALDDSLAEAHASLGIIQMHVDWDYVAAEAELKRAIELDPSSARAREWLVLLYVRTDRPAEALAEARRALELDPLSPSAHAEVAHALVANGRYDEALDRLERIAEVRPPLLRARAIAVQALAMKGAWSEALSLLRLAAEAGDAQSLALSVYGLARSGRRDEARRIRAELRDRWEQGAADSFHLLIADAGLRDLDEAFEWLDRAIHDRTLLNTHMNIMSPLFAELRADPRFDERRERLGLQKR